MLYLEPLDANPRVPTFVSGNVALVTGYEFADITAEPDFWASRIYNHDRPRVLAALDRRRADGVWSIQYR